MLHFPVSLMNRLNQTESAVFQLCRFTVFPNDPFSDYIVLSHFLNVLCHPNSVKWVLWNKEIT